MFKKYKKQLIISSILILLPIVFGLIMWDKLPDSFATHWSVDGQADGWSSKAFGVFFMPLLLVGMQLLCLWITDLTNRGREQSPKVMNLIFGIMPMVSLFSNGMAYAIALDKVWDWNNIMPIFMGLMFVVIGNYLPKCKQNTTIGIKLTWTLNNEENWNVTHRFAGKLWVAGGLITFFSAFLPVKIGYPIMFTALLVTAFGSVLYSYLYHRKQLKSGTAASATAVQLDPNAKWIGRIGCAIGIVLSIVCIFILFTGSIQYDFREDALVMDATFSAPITVRYENIEDIEYREGNVDGTRTGGFGSFRLLLGFFENEEFGTYSRYTYYKPDGCIVATVKGKTLVFSGENGEETREIYNTLLSKIG